MHAGAFGSSWETGLAIAGAVSARSPTTGAASGVRTTLGRYDYDTLADDLAAVVEEKGGRPTRLSSVFSMAGGEVPRYRSRHGGRTSAAALVASVVPYSSRPGHPRGSGRKDVAQMTEGMKQDRDISSRIFKDSMRRVGVTARERRGARMVSRRGDAGEARRARLRRASRRPTSGPTSRVSPCRR